MPRCKNMCLILESFFGTNLTFAPQLYGLTNLGQTEVVVEQTDIRSRFSCRWFFESRPSAELYRFLRAHLRCGLPCPSRSTRDLGLGEQLDSKDSFLPAAQETPSKNSSASIVGRCFEPRLFRRGFRSLHKFAETAGKAQVRACSPSGASFWC